MESIWWMCCQMCTSAEECTSSSWRDSKIYTSGRIANSSEDTKWNKQNLCCCRSKNFSGASHSVRPGPNLEN